MKMYGLIGRKLGHSYSPEIHAKLGNKAYALYELEPDALGSFLKQESVGGFNVTIPYKRDVLPFCDVIHDEVERIGAANTLVNRDGKLYAYNTDIIGFKYMVKESGIDVHGKKVLVLGSGGASRSVICALEDLGAGEIIIISRSGENNYDNIAKHNDADVIVNTTPVGMYPNNLASPICLKDFKHLCGVLDLIYNPLRTALIMEAQSLGIPNAGGLSMLVAQAEASDALFFNKANLPSTQDAQTSPTAQTSQTLRITRELTCTSENIILCGMPGCGKTTIAQKLSEMTGRACIDTDSEIVKSSGISIPEIFEREGETGFREREHAAILDAGKQSGKIISLGGGAVTVNANYAPLHQNGIIVFIHRDISALETVGRPLSKDLDTLRKMYAIRLPLYRSFADIEIDNNSDVETAAQQLLNKINNQ